ncbi:MAG: GNAT family N-acetyltransferase, partial [Calditrichaeota bacterium]
MELAENNPLDTGIIARLVTNREDLQLMFPNASWPFDHRQWGELIDRSKGNISFIVREGDQQIGHAALFNRGVPDTYTLGLLFIVPELRSQGFGRRMIGEVEKYAVQRLGVKRLFLRVRDFNLPALNCYLKCGYQ